MRWLYIFNESLQSAYRTVVLNKMRTFLSLLGVTIGIFSIVSVFTVVDSMETKMKKELESFGNDVIFIEKWPWAPENGQEYAWWEYLNRPVPTLKEYSEVKKRMTNVKSVCFIAAIQTDINYLDNTAENADLWGVSEEFPENRSFDIVKGRYLTPYEVSTNKNNCVIGYTIADEFFKDVNPIGRVIKVKGKNLHVIGVFAKEGKSFFGGGSLDNVVLIPVGLMGAMVDLKDDQSNPQIWVKAGGSISVDELKEDVRITMRAIRRLKPKAKDNFALNQTSMINSGLDKIFSVVDIAGWIIGIFAVLVGAFGIANIMFVSVKERTNIIGIQKALGAKSHIIILEVLYESMLLSLIGGLLGLILIYLGTIISDAKGFEITLSSGNVIFGIVISTTVGIIAGLAPAFYAAHLNPVKAIASTF